MELGMISSTWLGTKVSRLDGIRTAKEIGFDTYDVFEDPLDLTDEEREEIKQTAEEVGLPIRSVVCVALFFGGWHFPGLGGDVDPNHPSVTTSMWVCLLRSGVIFAKTLAIIFVFMWTRWSLPRFRFDQLMQLAWRGMIPIALAIVLVNALVLFFFGRHNATYREHLRLDGWMAVALLVSLRSELRSRP